MTSGQVFDIQHFSTHDGPGIRTTVFLKGCPLKCAWCHNPESWDLNKKILFSHTLCVDCKACENICPQNNARNILSDDQLRKRFCNECYLCADACNSGAIEKSGTKMTVQAVMKEVEKDRTFYENSRGGMTLSGGEPFYQFDFALEILQAAKAAGIQTVVETCGYVSQQSLEKALPFVDLFLYDIKLTDSDLHKKWTGVPLKIITENLRLIDSLGKKTHIRALLIPEVNMNEAHYKGLADIVNTLENMENFELIPYHELGNSKMQKLGKTPENNFSVPREEELDEAARIINEYLKKIY